METDGVKNLPSTWPHLSPLSQVIAVAVMDAIRVGAEERVLAALPAWAKRADNGELIARIAVDAVLGSDVH